MISYLDEEIRVRFFYDFSDGYLEIVNIDISSVVIEMMRKKYFNIPQLQCILCMITVFPVD
jgi:hypothetical protein